MIVIELLEELYEWSLLEYKHISSVWKKDVLFTNVREKDVAVLSALGNVEQKTVKELGLINAVLLDPAARCLLNPNEKFDHYILGGVLGNHPMDGRTGKELGSLSCEKRNLGDVQMSTDTAALVVKKIHEGQAFSDLTFKDGLSIEISDGFFNDLPYRYLVEDGKIVLPPGFVEFLTVQDDNLD